VSVKPIPYKRNSSLIQKAEHISADSLCHITQIFITSLLFNDSHFLSATQTLIIFHCWTSY